MAILSQRSCKLRRLDLDVGDLKENEIVNALIPMLRRNESLHVLRLMNTKVTLEITCQLLQALGSHENLKVIELRNSKLGCILETELRRFEREILAMAVVRKQLRVLILEQIFSNTNAISDEDLLVKKQIIANLEQNLPHLEHIKI